MYVCVLPVNLCDGNGFEEQLRNAFGKIAVMLLHNAHTYMQTHTQQTNDRDSKIETNLLFLS